MSCPQLQTLCVEGVPHGASSVHGMIVIPTSAFITFAPWPLHLLCAAGCFGRGYQGAAVRGCRYSRGCSAIPDHDHDHDHNLACANHHVVVVVVVVVMVAVHEHGCAGGCRGVSWRALFLWRPCAVLQR